jgi:hypothetical protein
LEKPQVSRRENVALKKKDAPLMNRFQLLNMDGTEDGSVEDEDQDNSGLTFQTTLSPSTLGIVV